MYTDYTCIYSDPCILITPVFIRVRPVYTDYTCIYSDPCILITPVFIQTRVDDAAEHLSSRGGVETWQLGQAGDVHETREEQSQLARHHRQHSAGCSGTGVYPSYRCHYTKSNPIDDHSNISSKKLQKQNFKPLGHYTCLQCGTSHLQKVQENILSRIITGSLQLQPSDSHKMSVAIFSPTPYINNWQMSLCNNSSDNKGY